MRLFRWLSARTIPPRFDLRLCGWELTGPELASDEADEDSRQYAGQHGEAHTERRPGQAIHEHGRGERRERATDLASEFTNPHQGERAIAKRTGVVVAIASVAKKWESSSPDPMPVFFVPSALYTSGSACSYDQTYQRRGIR